jgi:hypothetical protein
MLTPYATSAKSEGDTMKRITRELDFPVVVSVRFSEADFQRLTAIARDERRNLSQTVRLLIEDALDGQSQASR